MNLQPMWRKVLRACANAKNFKSCFLLDTQKRTGAANFDVTKKQRHFTR
ncbi:hypothetical protein N0A02_28055 [Paraburkholderia acidicola]|uniref:Uncharacterized protein n=1 Tax=Paraburkholderia acidicola TaxID=1912599 RepID=A0ABV1LVK7_9BURK